jgi:hypothetical protein
MPAFAVGIVDNEVKEDGRAQSLAVFGAEVEVVIIFVMRHIELQRARAERAFFTIDGWRN